MKLETGNLKLGKYGSRIIGLERNGRRLFSRKQEQLLATKNTKRHKNMKRISSKATYFTKSVNLFSGIIFLLASIGIWFSESEDPVITVIGSVMFGIGSWLCLWLSKNSCHLSLTHQGVHLRGIFKYDEVMLNNIYKIIDLWFFYPHLAIVKFNTKTKSGNTVIFYLKRTGLFASRTMELDALKRAIGK